MKRKLLLQIEGNCDTHKWDNSIEYGIKEIPCKCDTLKQITKWKLKMKLNRTAIGQKTKQNKTKRKMETQYRILIGRTDDPSDGVLTHKMMA